MDARHPRGNRGLGLKPKPPSTQPSKHARTHKHYCEDWAQKRLPGFTQRSQRRRWRSSRSKDLGHTCFFGAFCQSHVQSGNKRHKHFSPNAAAVLWVKDSEDGARASQTKTSTLIPHPYHALLDSRQQRSTRYTPTSSYQAPRKHSRPAFSGCTLEHAAKWRAPR